MFLHELSRNLEGLSTTPSYAGGSSSFEVAYCRCAGEIPGASEEDS